MSNDAKVLDEDPETRAKKFRHVRAGGENHFSMAFTYAWMAAEENAWSGAAIFFII